MKNFFNKKKNILKLILFVIMLFLFIFLGTRDYKVKVADNERFATEYKDISKNNIFKYVGEHEVLEILNGKSGILFLGFSSNIWCHYYADYLNEMAMLNQISEIYYYDFKRDRSLNNTTYHTIVKKLKEYLVTNDNGNMEIYAPTVIIVKNGELVYFNDDVRNIQGEVEPQEYFNKNKENLLKAEFELAIKKYMKDEVYEG